MSQEIQGPSAPPKNEKKNQYTFLKELITTGFESDFTLILGPEKIKVPVHKIFLQTRSPVLYSSINSVKESPSPNELIIGNVDIRIFKLMLQFLYTGYPGVGVKELGDALHLLQLATEYEVTELGDEMASLLKVDLTPDSVLPLFEAAMKYAHKELIQSTLDFICRFGYKIVKREEFANLGLECLMKIIQQDKLRVTDEMDVFKALYRWGEAECERTGVDIKDIRKILEKPLKHIRFPLMDKEEFALNVANKGILDQVEWMSLLTYITCITPKRRKLLPVGQFSSTPRNYVSDGIVFARCSPEDVREKSDSSAPLTETLMIFSEYADQDVQLRSIGIWKSIFDVQKPQNNEEYYCHYKNTITATVTMKHGQEIIQLKNRPLVVNGKFLELKFEKALTLPNWEWVELNLVISGFAGFCCVGSDHSDYRRYNLALKHYFPVTNYGDFLELPISGENNSLRLSFQRKINGDNDSDVTDGDDDEAVGNTPGLIEKLVFEAV